MCLPQYQIPLPSMGVRTYANVHMHSDDNMEIVFPPGYPMSKIRAIKRRVVQEFGAQVQAFDKMLVVWKDKRELHVTKVFQTRTGKELCLISRT